MKWLPAVLTRYDELAQEIAEQMAALPWPQSRTSPDEGAASMLRNSWEEFAREIQEDQSVYWDIYHAQVRTFIFSLVENLDWQDTALLWCATDESMEKSEVDQSLQRSEMQEAIEEKLWQVVKESAGSYDLSHYFEWREDAEDSDEADEDAIEQTAEQPRLF